MKKPETIATFVIILWLSYLVVFYDSSILTFCTFALGGLLMVLGGKLEEIAQRVDKKSEPDIL